MKMSLGVLVLSSILVVARCVPTNYQYLERERSRRNPNQAMFPVLYEQPAADVHLQAGEDCKNCVEYGVISTEDSVTAETTTQFAEPQIEISTPTSSKRERETQDTDAPETAITKEEQPPKEVKPPTSKTRENEDDPILPGTRFGKNPLYNFFPVMFGYSGFGRSGAGVAGGATAIANSFSTGRGGVATSHATALGDPTGAFRNANWNRFGQ